LVVIWCPELLEEGARGEEARRFARVQSLAGELCPWLHPIRLGVCALPARGPARFFGGEEAVVSRLVEAVDEEAKVGVADGLFAAVLAARSELIVPAGGTADFLGPWSVATLGRPDLAVTLQRLGVTTLGQLAALPAASISDRFGADAAACHAVARGESGELVGLRDRAIERRLRVARGEDPDRGADAPPPPSQPGFFGGASEADARAARSFVRVQERLGIEAVLMGRVQGGRDPAGQSVLVPWGSPGAHAAGREAGATGGVAGGAPWPGRVPPPAPSDVLGVPLRAEVVDAAGCAVEVSGRGLLTAGIDRLSVHGGPWQPVVGWAGPWPVTERWWSVRRRRARMQVVTADGVARLLCTERGQWWVEALYD
jgi:protein ImuB